MSLVVVEKIRVSVWTGSKLILLFICRISVILARFGKTCADRSFLCTNYQLVFVSFHAFMNSCSAFSWPPFSPFIPLSPILLMTILLIGNLLYPSSFFHLF